MSRKTKGEKIFEFAIVIGMAIMCFAIVYPVWYCVVQAFNDGEDAMLGGIYWWPREFTLNNFKAVFANSDIINAFGISVARTLIGTFTSVLFTSIVAYTFSRKHLIGRKFYLALGTVTLFFNGGLIPTFLLVKSIGLYDNFLVYILLPLFNFYNCILIMNYFKTLPESLEESARIDGSDDFGIFFKIVLPISTPIIATIALFNGVVCWNDYYMGVVYINSDSLQPIQTYLYKVIAQSSAEKMAVAAAGDLATSSVTSTSIKMATMVVTTLPIICAYPFLQKYFAKGLMAGAVKG